jgi:lipopolysaccharide export system permease protein
MIGRTLFLYFFRRYLTTFVQFFIGVCIIAYLVDFTELSRVKSTMAGYTLGKGLLISALHVPLIAQLALPFVVLFAAIATLMALNRRYELVIARSAGVSAWQFLGPLCTASLLIGATIVVLVNPIGAHALAWSQQLEVQLKGEDYINNPSDDRVPWLRQRDDDGVTIIGAKSMAAGGMQLGRAVFVRVGLSGDIKERIDADSAHLEAGKWVIEGATIRRPDKAPELVDRMEIKSNLSPEFVEERLSRPESIPFFDLPAKMRAAWSFGLNGNGFGMQFHSLIALPVLLVAMTLIAATVSMRFARLGQSVTMILSGVLAGFLLYVMSVLVKAFGTAGIVPPVVAAWIPVVVAMFFGVTFLLYREDG